MKTNRLLWKRISLLLLFSIVISLSFLISCEKENITPNEPKIVNRNNDNRDELLALPQLCSEITYKNLLLKNNSRVGAAYFFNDREFFYAHIVAQESYKFKNAYLNTSLLDEIPLTVDLNPDYGRFNHKIETETYTRVFRFKIPIEQLKGQFIVSLAVQTLGTSDSDELKLDISRYQLAWADGKSYGSTILGKYFTYKKGICLYDDPVSVNE
jgi:hypothetical protein